MNTPRMGQALGDQIMVGNPTTTSAMPIKRERLNGPTPSEQVLRTVPRGAHLRKGLWA
jgi:hypothetical protein